MAYVFIASIVAFRVAGWERFADHNDTWILARVAALRTPWLTHVARAIKAFGSGWPISIIGLGLVALLMIFRRWRHLLVFLGGLFVLLQVGNWLYQLVSRPRPYGVRIMMIRSGLIALRSSIISVGLTGPVHTVTELPAECTI